MRGVGGDTRFLVKVEGGCGCEGVRGKGGLEEVLGSLGGKARVGIFGGGKGGG